ncbi:MAG: hypothetical protein FDX30_12220 [Chlorobium sp.]|nr:MAG: hypothetical protein FDX30_12220 [Chlorobium sp.]
MLFVLGSLAVWRMTHLIVAEDGPWDLVVRLRALLGDSMAGRAMDCFYCSSMWISVPFAVFMARDVPEGVLFWLALSGSASLLEQATSREKRNEPNDNTG